jgi:hypothetical protein
MNIFKSSQFSSEYYSGPVPEYQPSGGIDYSQISGVFSGANEAMDLVTKYAPTISQDISYIFNFSNAGAYGVYVPALSEEIKKNELKRQLESRNYSIQDENGVMVAYPLDENKSHDDAQNEIKQLWSQIDTGKSEIIGVNMNKVVQTCQANMENIKRDIEAAGGSLEDPKKLWDMLVILELGATIIHEYTHTKQGDEGAAEMTEKDFVQKMMPYVKSRYQQETGESMPFATASSLKKQVTSQFAHNLTPNAPPSMPTGSDLLGRMNYNPTGYASEGMGEWAAILNMGKDSAIESKLGRQFVWWLHPSISQEHNSIEEQLRKQTIEDHKPDTSLIYERLLMDDWDNEPGYKHIEQLLDEKRPHPLMLPLKKTASKFTKIATLFGWYNNLEISDGSTIPGLSDRVMAWDDRDESFSEEESWIRSQPRYNPSYDLKGFYYRWIEPRFQPQLWTSMLEEHSNTSPAKRFANKSNNEDTDDLKKISRIIHAVIDKIVKEDIRASRMVMSPDIMPHITKILKEYEIGYKVYKDVPCGNEELLVLWAYDPSLKEDLILQGEKDFRSRKTSKILEFLLKIDECKKKAIDKIVNTIKQASTDLCINDVYIIGAYARNLFSKIENNDISAIEISTLSLQDNNKLIQKISEILGCPIKYGNKISKIYYGDIKIEISNVNATVQTQNRKYNYIVNNLLNRDFTINTFAYNVVSGKVFDFLETAKTDLNAKIIRLVQYSDDSMAENPLIGLKAVCYSVENDMVIDEELAELIIKNSNKIIRVISDDLYMGRCALFLLERMFEKNKRKSINMLKDLNLNNIINKIIPFYDGCQK